jgi:hypothetical protein
MCVGDIVKLLFARVDWTHNAWDACRITGPETSDSRTHQFNAFQLATYQTESAEYLSLFGGRLHRSIFRLRYPTGVKVQGQSIKNEQTPSMLLSLEQDLLQQL